MLDSQRHLSYERKREQLLSTVRPLLESEISDNKTSDAGLVLRKDTSNLFRPLPENTAISNAPTNSKTDARTQPRKNIDLRNFNEIISIDTHNMVAEVEAMATYEKIVQETLKYDCLPAVVPELKSITIGGALAGVGIESSSFRYGLVHETLLEYEVLLPDGRIVNCRPDNPHKDLYFAFPNTYGTLGYALKVKVKLIPAKKYVKLTHIHFEDPNDYFNWIRKTCEEDHIDYIDGAVFDKKNLYATVGEFIDEAPFVSNYKYLNIFYRSIRKKKIDYLKTIDYIWRWDTDWFWCSKHFMMENPFFRALFGKFMLKSTAYWKIRNFFNTNKLARKISDWFLGENETVIQDIEVPVERAVEFLNFFQEKIAITPIWICPIRPYHKDVQYSFYRMNQNLYINFGFWDMVPTKKGEPLGFYNRLIEKKVEELQGNKSLYSSVYYTPEEFWKIYDKDLYQHLKRQYDPKSLQKDLYQKCVSSPPN